MLTLNGMWYRVVGKSKFVGIALSSDTISFTHICFRLFNIILLHEQYKCSVTCCNGMSRVYYDSNAKRNRNKNKNEKQTHIIRYIGFYSNIQTKGKHICIHSSNREAHTNIQHVLWRLIFGWCVSVLT